MHSRPGFDKWNEPQPDDVSPVVSTSTDRFDVPDSSHPEVNMNKFRGAILALVSAAILVSIPALGAKEPPAMTYVKAKCALCHGKDGRADTPAGKQSGAPNFKLADIQSRSDEEMAAVITHGKGRMPAFRDRLDDEQVRLMVRYVRELGEKN